MHCTEFAEAAGVYIFDINLALNQDTQRIKLARRIVRFSDVYRNDFEKLVQLEVPELEKLQTDLLIPLCIRMLFRMRVRK